MAKLSEKQAELFSGKNWATVVTLRKDGSPHSTPVWIDTDGEHVIFNTAIAPTNDVDVRQALYYALNAAELTTLTPGQFGTAANITGLTPASAGSVAAARSGSMSLAKAPMPDSEPARYFSLPGARRIVNSSRCRANSSRSAWRGAWCQAEMYGAGSSKSRSNRRSRSR